MEELRTELREKIEQFTDDIVNMTLKHSTKMTVARLREARARAGQTERKNPYGEHPAYPDEKEGLELMIRMRKEQHPYRTIAEAMERHGFRTRAGKMWNPGTVIRILRRHELA